MENKEDYNNEINLFSYLNVFKKYKWLIAIIITVPVIITGTISCISPKIYRATAAIIPASQQQEQIGMSSIAAQIGISTAPALNVSEIIRLLNSNILMEKTIKKNNLLPVFFTKDELKKMIDISRIWNGIRYLKEIFNVTYNPREGIIELSVEFKDPATAADIINYILTELTEYMSSEAKRVAESNKEYLESLINENADPLIGQKIYHLIAKQIETAMMAEVKENFAFKILDPPKKPDKKVRPKTMRNIILSFVVSLFTSPFLVFFIEYIKKINMQKQM